MKSIYFTAILTVWLSSWSALTGSVLAQPGSCPGQGWSEGLPMYLGTGVKFPVQDTQVKVEQDGQTGKRSYVYPNNCAFHQWSWEAFVWSTNMYWQYGPEDPTPGPRAPRFLSMHTPDELTDEEPATGNTSLRLLPRGLKRGSRIEDFRQAGSGGILVDLQHNAVYYSVHMNDLYFGFVQKYYGRQAYNAATPTETFPLGAAVFKASWKIVSGNAAERTPAWFTTAAVVPKLVNQGGKVVPDPSGATEDVTVALVGLHVVGRTADHPELIWGSFEHVDNAPSLADPNDYDSPNPVSENGFTFYTAGTPANACNHMVTDNKVVDGKLQTVNNVFRQYARGGLTEVTPVEFDSINSQAQSEMRALQQPQEPGIPAYPLNTVWANYMLIGTVWQPVPVVEYPTPLPPTIVPGDSDLFASASGSVELENATLETFVQGPQNNAGGHSNCFMCHNTAGSTKFGFPGKDINISHQVLGPLFGSKP